MHILSSYDDHHLYLYFILHMTMFLSGHLMRNPAPVNKILKGLGHQIDLTLVTCTCTCTHMYVDLGLNKQQQVLNFFRCSFF
jgi:hypothetical protein